LVGDEDSLVQSGLINSLADSPERIESLLATLALFEKVPDSLFDQVIPALIPAAGRFLLNLLSQIGWQRYLHGCSPHFILRCRDP
jgi:hypothetical protein